MPDVQIPKALQFIKFHVESPTYNAYKMYFLKFSKSFAIHCWCYVIEILFSDFSSF